MFEEQKYIPEEWLESKGDGTSATFAYPLPGDEKLEFYSGYMLYYHKGYDGKLRVDCFPYSHIATYHKDASGKEILLYTKQLYQMVHLRAEAGLSEVVLSHIGGERLPLSEFIVSVYGESGKRIYPKGDDLLGDELMLYENYVRCDSENGISIMRYENIRTIDCFGVSIAGLEGLSVTGETPDGGYGGVFAVQNFDFEKREQYIRLLEKKVLKKQKKVLVSRHGVGEVKTRLFYREDGERPIEKPLVLSNTMGETFLLTFFEQHFTLKTYAYSKNTPSGEEVRVSYADVVYMNTTSRKDGFGGTVFEVTLTCQNATMPLRISTSGANAKEGFKRTVDLLRERIQI